MTRVIISIFIVSLLACHICRAQEEAVLSFEETVWDFGSIKEAGGPVSHTFRFTNTSDEAIVLERVQADCGCTTPLYGREPVKPGAQGEIEVTFNPINFSGPITKTVSVFCNNGKSRNLLTIKANVESKPRPIKETHPFDLAPGVVADRLSVPFAYIGNGSVNSMVVEIVNTTENSVAIGVDSITGDGRLTVAVPGKLSAGERGSITLTYDLRRLKSLYGMISDQVYLTVDGLRRELPVNVSAIVVDDFGGQDPALGAGCVITPTYYNFGAVKAGDPASGTMTISNPGKSPLIIRSVDARRGAATSLKEGTVIAPGKSGEFTVSLDTTGGRLKTGRIIIIVNEQQHPMREIRLNARITN